ncbi:MAG: FAD-dependent oxidoreductase [Chloroflexota bacterium]
MNKKKKQIVIVGAGYAGLLAAVRLWKKTKRLSVAITLVDAEATFGERTRFQQLATGQQLTRWSIVDFLHGTAVHFCQGYVSQLDPQQQQITIETAIGNQQLPYDYLLVALGSTTQVNTVPGAKQFAYTLNRDSARALARQMAHRNGGEQLVIVGGGPTGLEAAAEFAEQHPDLRVTLLTDNKIGQMLSSKAEAYLRQALERLQIEVREGVRITAVFETHVQQENGEQQAYDYCLWTGGFVASPLAQKAGVTVNQRNQILIDPTMRSVSHPTIYAVGDAAHSVEPPGAPVRMSQFFALVSGAHAADCLVAQLTNRPAHPFGMSWVGLAVSLGRQDCVAQFLRPNDTPLNLYLTGKAAVSFKEFFVKFAIWSINIQRTAPWMFAWLGKNKMRGKHATNPPMTTPAILD